MEKRKPWPLTQTSCTAELAHFVKIMTPDMPDVQNIVKQVTKAVRREWEECGRRKKQYNVNVSVSTCKIKYQCQGLDLECELPHHHQSACWSDSVTIAHVAAIFLEEETLVKQVAQEVADALPDGIRVVFAVEDGLLKYTKEVSGPYEQTKREEETIWPDRFYDEYQIILDWIDARPVHYTFGAEKRKAV